MTHALKLFMVLLGASPKGRLTEQHDIFFGIGSSLKDLVPQIRLFWPEAKATIHIDSWREITIIDGYSISVVDKLAEPQSKHLFFINLGGYKVDEIEEYHYKVLAIAETMGMASKISKQTTFYKHFGFKGAESHIDEKYGIDVDDLFKVEDILSPQDKQKYSLLITTTNKTDQDIINNGYVRLEKLEKKKLAEK